VALRVHDALRVLAAERRGSSLPVVVQTAGRCFLTKLRGAAHGTAALVAEIIVAELAESIDLNVPARALIRFHRPVASDDGNDELADLLAASTGLNLAFEVLDNARDLRPADVDRIDEWTSSRIVWLDALVMNPDRTRRNPNVMLASGRVWLIDHGSALGFHHAWASVTEDTPLRPAPLDDHVLAARATRLAELDEPLAERLTRDIVRAAVAAVPDDFLEPLVAAGGGDSLSRRREAYAAFLWKRLKAPRRFFAGAVAAGSK
jgi:hypothetical protein